MQRFALIGAGFIGSVHAASLAANAGIDFRLVYDVDPDRAGALAAEHGAEAVADVDRAFDPAEIDAVVIASSTDTHAEHLRRAADAGIAAFVEKPIDAALDRAVEIVEYVEAAGIPAMVDFNRRFDRDHAELQRLVRTGELGTPSLVQMTSRGPSLPPIAYLEVSGGQMRDQTVHFFDLARWILGVDPVEVQVMGAVATDPRVGEIGDVDTSVATLRLPGGGLVQIDSVRETAYGYDERIEVLGSKGLAESGRMRAGNVTRLVGDRAVSNGLHAGWFERVQPTYAASLDAFVRALEAGSSVMPVTLRDGLKAQAVAEAATRSLASGRAERIEYPG
ncbi:Gfo/Idh/MocA family oxidoreductase [Gulosibacter sp. 10]|uniref:Gfo/Idh/MocA family protein n=1 Tax=Gulosibacter sp. 10 TaxID=1255570 RepID=UPI00097E8304|nr:Gfo/Idh/MocA family oxidoreductase [Gulosibacter sp. 10]SJM67410.1 Myo-inositol 2-dehydrogenase [Gulosibacter sp. 10]